MANASTKFEQGIHNTGNQALINSYQRTNGTFQDMQQMVEDSGLDRPLKNKLKKLARNAYE